MIVVSVLLAELLKKVILPRPDLLAGTASGLSKNLFPRGHTTIAVATAVAMVMIVLLAVLRDVALDATRDDRLS